MKKIDRQIRSIVFEIVVLITFLFVSYNVWDNFNFEEQARIAYAYSNFQTNLILKMEKNIDSLVIMSDDVASKYNNITFNVLNINNVSKSYNLYIKYDIINSDLNKDYLKISYNNKISNLADLDSFVKGNYIYYKINKSTIDKKSNNKYDFNLYLSTETPSSEFNRHASLDFYVEEI